MAHGCGWMGMGGKKVYMSRCFKCGEENYQPAVASGRCSFCGYDANKDVILKARMVEQWTFDKLSVFTRELAQ